jgi:hypothetical protein
VDWTSRGGEVLGECPKTALVPFGSRKPPRDQDDGTVSRPEGWSQASQSKETQVWYPQRLGHLRETRVVAHSNVPQIVQPPSQDCSDETVERPDALRQVHGGSITTRRKTQLRTMGEECGDPFSYRAGLQISTADSHYGVSLLDKAAYLTESQQFTQSCPCAPQLRESGCRIGRAERACYGMGGWERLWLDRDQVDVLLAHSKPHQQGGAFVHEQPVPGVPTAVGVEQDDPHRDITFSCWAATRSACTDDLRFNT